ncbi:substrate-binding domain-containing protein [Vibrio sp. ZSDZ65]|uniref:Autoinducer 2-binding periplasmic protein LuxP n=1 Tax=Vibrio qingdaonensis TaxID=2829491 RepID=A0A9X3CLW8_9VIBR|nr:substrate-binding domain-containing protein [Vibrio qingdaonensis]MCW8345813.1 substrate-binding domain-containing protein [Vibrio qingdaonensis]
MREQHKALLQKLASVGGLIALLIAFSIASPYFMTVNNMMTVGLQTSTITIIGIGVMLTILTGGIDLSIGSVMALSGVTAGLAVNAGVPVPFGMVIGVLTGAGCGLFNGLCVSKLRLPPFIATLGMMMIARGVALYITNAAPVSGMPESFSYLGNGALFRMVEIGDNGFPNVIFAGIPYPVIVMLLVVAAFSFLLTKMRLGRYLYAIGSNEEAARLSGIDTDKVKTAAYMASGMLAGLAGVIIASRLVTAQPNGSVMAELDAIASAVVGGTSLMGGVGTVTGAVIGSFIIGVLRNGLNMNGVSYFVQQIVIGGVIIATVAYDQYRMHKSTVKSPTKKSKKDVKDMKINKIATVAAIGFTLSFTGMSTDVTAAEKEIAVVVKTENSNFWQNVKGGSVDAANGLDSYKITFQGPAAETAVDEQVNMIQNALNRGVAGLVVAPTDPNALVPALKAAWERGVPVALIDSGLNDDDKYHQAYLSTDNRAAGRLAAEQMIKALNGKKGKVAMMSFTAGSGSAMDRDGGFKEVIEAAGYEVVGPYYSNADMVTALNQTVDVLASNNDLVGIFGSNEPTAVGMARAIEQGGYTGKIVAVAFDGNKDIQEFIRDGVLDGAVVQSSYGMGFMGVVTVAEIIAGKKTASYIDTGVVYVTQDNIDGEKAQAVLY